MIEAHDWIALGDHGLKQRGKSALMGRLATPSTTKLSHLGMKTQPMPVCFLLASFLCNIALQLVKSSSPIPCRKAQLFVSRFTLNTKRRHQKLPSRSMLGSMSKWRSKNHAQSRFHLGPSLSRFITFCERQ